MGFPDYYSGKGLEQSTTKQSLVETCIFCHDKLSLDMKNNSKTQSNSPNQYTTLGWANSPTRKTENIWNLWEIVPTTNYQLSIFCTPCPRLIGAYVRNKSIIWENISPKSLRRRCVSIFPGPLQKNKNITLPILNRPFLVLGFCVLGRNGRSGVNNFTSGFLVKVHRVSAAYNHVAALSITPHSH